MDKEKKVDPKFNKNKEPKDVPFFSDLMLRLRKEWQKIKKTISRKVVKKTTEKQAQHKTQDKVENSQSKTKDSTVTKNDNSATITSTINRKDQKPIISVRNLRKVFRMGEEKIVALNRVSLDIYRGEFVCLLGQSGSGKSTFLNMLAGLEKPTSGTIHFGKIPVHTLNEDEITYLRQKNIGFIFQAYHLLPTLTALENVALPLAFKGIIPKKRNMIAHSYLEKVGIANLYKRKPTQMSGGQQQRVGIARALALEPKIIFADEPTGNLDTKTTKEILTLLKKCIREYKQTLILVTHEPSMAKFADVVVTMSDGNIVDFWENESPLEFFDKQEQGAKETETSTETSK